MQSLKQSLLFFCTFLVSLNGFSNPNLVMGDKAKARIKSTTSGVFKLGNYINSLQESIPQQHYKFLAGKLKGFDNAQVKVTEIGDLKFMVDSENQSVSFSFDEKIGHFLINNQRLVFDKRKAPAEIWKSIEKHMPQQAESGLREFFQPPSAHAWVLPAALIIYLYGKMAVSINDSSRDGYEMFIEACKKVADNPRYFKNIDDDTVSSTVSSTLTYSVEFDHTFTVQCVSCDELSKELNSCLKVVLDKAPGHFVQSLPEEVRENLSEEFPDLRTKLGVERKKSVRRIRSKQ
ncbi:MAG: hypothetical protein CL677_01905 [Bdellovibrionaceae bacterium]|nr:hypothetical protein [Pseudobdellovibrionaceae bacterium]|tara:strand:+ start:116945 stop:117814 length:870 start_codon:yes stop_codon:yes gene_type:complete